MKRRSTNRPRPSKGWSPARKLLASLAVLGAAASIAGLGTFATFTSSTSASHTRLVRHRHDRARRGRCLDQQADRRRTRGRAGRHDPAEFDLSTRARSTSRLATLTTTATTSSLLDTDTTNGLQMVIDKCSAAWTEAGPPYTYSVRRHDLDGSRLAAR